MKNEELVAQLYIALMRNGQIDAKSPDRASAAQIIALHLSAIAEVQQMLKPKLGGASVTPLQL